MQYVPLERSLNPTGIRVMDDYLRFLSGGCADTALFAGRYGARIGDIDIARLCGYGTRGNFYFAYLRDFGCPPSDRRLQLQHLGEKDMYKIL